MDSPQWPGIVLSLEISYHSMDWVYGKIYRNPPYFMVKTMVSCRFCLQTKSIESFWFKLVSFWSLPISKKPPSRNLPGNPERSPFATSAIGPGSNLPATVRSFFKVLSRSCQTLTFHQDSSVSFPKSSFQNEFQ